MRSPFAFVSVAMIVALWSMQRPADAQGLARSEEARCAGVTAAHEIEFHGRTLLETPDIQAPELRRANALINARCFGEALAARDRYKLAQPDDFHVFFLDARLAWILQSSRSRAEAIVNESLREHPQFTSARVLQASMKIADRDFSGAQAVLDVIEKEQPRDLWLFVDRLQIEASLTPTIETVKTMREIMDDQDFPPSVHAQIEQIANYGMALPEKERDAMFRAAMNNGAGTECMLVERASDLLEVKHDPKAAAALIEEYLGKAHGCYATALVRTILAETYLMQAAAISQSPVAANAALVRRAKKVMHGDLTPVARRLARDPRMTPIIPLLKGSIDHQAVNDEGQTLICEAVSALNPVLVNEELSAGVSANQRCRHSSLVMTLLLVAATQKVEERQQILIALLSHGARVEGMEGCADSGSGDCSRVFLPILKDYDARRGKDRVTL